ncbi:MAG TPA: AMP-binding protein, partial [Arenibaculum sp.]|nr:AMP-binding protein [Arenibaculum sp.]
MQDSLGDIVRGWAAGQPDELALSDGRRDLTFRDIETEASAFARRLQSLGIRKGDRILLIAEKRWEIVVAAIGIWKA